MLGRTGLPTSGEREHDSQGLSGHDSNVRFRGQKPNPDSPESKCNVSSITCAASSPTKHLTPEMREGPRALQSLPAQALARLTSRARRLLSPFLLGSTSYKRVTSESLFLGSRQEPKSPAQPGHKAVNPRGRRGGISRRLFVLWPMNLVLSS